MTSSPTVERILSKLEKVTPRGTGWTARCPGHEDSNPSLSIAQGDNGCALLKCHAGCSNDAIVSAIGLKLVDLFPQRQTTAKDIPRVQVAAYQYTDEQGKLLFEKIRFDPKGFSLRSPAGRAGSFKENVQGVRRVLYRLPEIIKAVERNLPVFICEGEKDCDRLASLKLVATCNFDGAGQHGDKTKPYAGKWMVEYGEVLRGAEVVIIADKDAPGRAHAADIACKLKAVAKRVAVLELPDVGDKAVKDTSDFFGSGGTLEDFQALVDTALLAAAKPEASAIVKLLAEREFKFDIEPPPLRPIFSLAGTPICTPANLTTITSAIKTGKSAVIGAMVAAALPHAKDADLLGFSSSNPKGHAVLWFDSEQSPDDFWHCVTRALKRSGVASRPEWLHAYCLTGLGCKRAWECVTEATKLSADTHGGVHSILIDGIADLVADVNDPEESNSFVAELHAIAIKHDCPIIGVIHFNPGTEKSRGHLGSQIERKAETNLALEKDSDETTVIYSTKNRRAGIPKGTGPRFMFSPEAAMHVSVSNRRCAKDEEQREALVSLAFDVFEGRPAMRFNELQTTVKKLLTVSPKTAERKIIAMGRLAVIKKSVGGMYVLTKQASTN